MHPQVRDIFKRIVLLAKDHPNKDNFLERARRFIDKNRNIDVNNERELKTALTKAKWMLKEEMAVARLIKYRELQRRYGSADDRFDLQVASQDQDEDRSMSNQGGDGNTGGSDISGSSSTRER